MLALNQQFTTLATFCSLAAMSLFPLSVDAVAIQGRASDRFAPAAPFRGLTPPNSDENKHWGREHKKRTFDWSPINNVIRMADMAINAARHPYYGSTVKRNSYENQVYFHPRDDIRHEKRLYPVRVPKNQGGSYLVSPKSRPLHAGHGETTKRGENLREESGRIDLVSPAAETSDAKKLGSLVMESSDGQWVLNASQHNYTSVSIANVSPEISSVSMPLGEDGDVLVRLIFPSPDPSSSQTNVVSYCATSKGNTTSTEPQSMTVEKCFDKAQEKSDEQKSQIFAYNEKTGVVRPMWVTGQDDNESDDPTTPNKSDVAAVTSVTGKRGEAGKQMSATNVDLVFVPNNPKVAANAEGDLVTATSTMTTTITVTSMGTATPSPSAADFEPTSTPNASPSPSSVPSGSDAASTPVSTPAASAAALDVQVVSPNNTSSIVPAVASMTRTSDSSVATTSMTAQAVESSNVSISTTDTPKSTATTTSVNAEDVATSIAASTGIPSPAASTSTVTNDTSSTAIPTVAAAENSLSANTTSPAPTMAPVDPAPYQMRFKAEK